MFGGVRFCSAVLFDLLFGLFGLFVFASVNPSPLVLSISLRLRESVHRRHCVTRNWALRRLAAVSNVVLSWQSNQSSLIAIMYLSECHQANSYHPANRTYVPPDPC